MAKLKLKGKDLRKIGYPEALVVGMAMQIAHKHCKHQSKEEVLMTLEDILENPKEYKDHEFWSPVADEFVPDDEPPRNYETLNENSKAYKTYGAKHIDQLAKRQMETVMRLPIVEQGALMPDAHGGYGMPIGGVVATKNAIMPYGVGMDIGCRMCLTVYDISAYYIGQHKKMLRNMLHSNTKFGMKEVFYNPDTEHEIFDRKEWQEVGSLRRLKHKAYSQLGSSGGGNHFVEFGEVDLYENNEFNLPPGKYLGILSHSGSRGMGANIAQYYTRWAMDRCNLPKPAQNLAWLDLDSEPGQEYWIAMNLAGDYASACHHDIHRRLSTALGEKPAFMVENHHNFAWKEQLEDGTEVVVHRKGATPAGKGVLGIIPGSMTAPGYIVRGKGVAQSINSASHGAGRKMSRTKAKSSITNSYLKKYLKEKGVHLIGGGLDEAPMAYKDIDRVMDYQKDLVDVLGSFTPKIVRMADDR